MLLLQTFYIIKDYYRENRMLKFITFFLILLYLNITARAQYNPAPITLNDSTSLIIKADPIQSNFAITSVTHADSSYNRPKKWQFIKKVPGDMVALAASPFQKKNLLGLSVIAGSTAILIWKDQALSDGAKYLARAIHLRPENNYHVIFSVKGQDIEKLPRNINSALYQMGEGGTSMLLAGGLYVYGKIHHDFRSLQTASDISEAFVTMGIATQLLKRIVGRQSPYVATAPGGLWHPFTPTSEYQQHVPKYDAFPSGHLATIMATVTVLAKNYPEKTWIKPIGYTILSVVGFAMMNNGVHWAGDYPLAIGLGYICGSITVAQHKQHPNQQN